MRSSASPTRLARANCECFQLEAWSLPLYPRGPRSVRFTDHFDGMPTTHQVDRFRVADQAHTWAASL